MTGKVLIEVCDENDNVKYTVEQKNEIVDYYKKYPFVVQHLRDGTGRGYGLCFGIPDDTWEFPLVKEDKSFSFSESRETWNNDSGLPNTTWQRHIEESNTWEEEKRVLEFKSINYFEGPFTFKGLIMFVLWIAVRGPLVWNHIFSALDMDPYIEVASNERVYIHYKLIMEW